MNRAITIVVQITLFFGVVACLRLMWGDLKSDLREIKNDLRK